MATLQAGDEFNLHEYANGPAICYLCSAVNVHSWNWIIEDTFQSSMGIVVKNAQKQMAYSVKLRPRLKRIRQ